MHSVDDMARERLRLRGPRDKRKAAIRGAERDGRQLESRVGLDGRELAASVSVPTILGAATGSAGADDGEVFRELPKRLLRATVAAYEEAMARGNLTAARLLGADVLKIHAAIRAAAKLEADMERWTQGEARRAIEGEWRRKIVEGQHNAAAEYAARLEAFRDAAISGFRLVFARFWSACRREMGNLPGGADAVERVMQQMDEMLPELMAGIESAAASALDPARRDLEMIEVERKAKAEMGVPA